MTKRLNKIVPASLNIRGILFVGISLVLAGVGLLLALFIGDQNIRVFGLSLGIALVMAVFGFIAGLHFIDHKTRQYSEQIQKSFSSLEELERDIDEDLKQKTKKNA